MVTACAITLYLIWRVRAVVRLVGISLFFALALVPMVDAIGGKIRAPRWMIILAVYLVLIAGVAVVGYVVVPSLVKEVHQLSRTHRSTPLSCATTPPFGTTTIATTSAPSSSRTRAGCRSCSGI